MIGELIEKLAIANIKLYNVCNQKADMANNPGAWSKEQMADVMRKDIELCKQRANLKKSIDNAINDAIMHQRASVIDEVKNYGSS